MDTASELNLHDGLKEGCIQCCAVHVELGSMFGCRGRQCSSTQLQWKHRSCPVTCQYWAGWKQGKMEQQQQQQQTEV